MAVILFRPILPSDDFPKVIMRFYKALQHRYMDNTRGQQQSLIPLPLLALDIQSHSPQDIQNALKMVEMWMEELRKFFESSDLSKMKDSDEFWKGAVETLFRDLRDQSSPSTRSPASEKVRSIFFHLLMKCRANAAPKAREGERVTAEEINTSPRYLFKNFEMEWRELLGSSGKAKARRGRGTKRTDEERGLCLSTSEEEADAQALKSLLEKKSFRFVQVVDCGDVQGCEFDVVVACMFDKASPSRGGSFFHFLSRAKLLSIVISPRGLMRYWESRIGTRFSGHFRDWREFEQTLT
jgi:hypothetical protein